MQFQSEDCAKKVNIKHAGTLWLDMPDERSPSRFSRCFSRDFLLGDIKSFFGAKTEQNDPQAGSPVAPASQVKREDGTGNNAAASTPVKKEARHDPQQETTPKKQFEQFPAKFVPASSLLSQRSDDKVHSTPPPKRRRVATSPAKTPPKAAKPSSSKSPSTGPKQSSLDFFFGKGPK
jgi:hypothetical protein